MSEELIGIGPMARLTGLTVKALRYYDRTGLLRPAAVDPASGFRFYAPGQVLIGRLINDLRRVDLPTDEVRAILAGSADADADECTRKILLRHRARLEARLTGITGRLHDLIHLLEDGTPMATTNAAVADHRAIAVGLFNDVWTQLGKDDRSRADDDRMLHMAHASRFHWGEIGGPENLARGEWQCSRVYAARRRPEPCLHHARRVLDLCVDNGIGDWDLAFAYEALARGHAVAGDPGQARAMTEKALAAAADIADDDDRAIVLADLETIPGQPRFW